MKIKPDDKKIRSFTKKYWREGRKVLYLNSRKVVDLIGKVPIDQIKGRAANMLDSVELRDYIGNTKILDIEKTNQAENET